MMPRDLKEQNDFVAGTLGIRDWKPNQSCKGMVVCNLRSDDNCICLDCGTKAAKPNNFVRHSHAHNIPAPDLLANPWMLVEALLKADYGIDFWVQADDGTVGCNVLADGNQYAAYGPNAAAALLQAAADMLKKEMR